MIGGFRTIILVVLLQGVPLAGPALAAQKIKYERTEVEKARGKCVAAVLFGGIAGALIGRATGKKNVAEGAVIGLAAGAGACAMIMATAKQKDRIIAAQISAARERNGFYTTTFAADDGQSVMMQAQAGAEQTLSATNLRPVKYSIDGTAAASPVLEGDGQLCRPVAASLQSAAATSNLPSQMICRTPQGDYAPYAVVMAGKSRPTTAS